MQLPIATSNPNKIREIQAILNQPIEQIEIELAEVQAVAVEEVIEQKAREAFHKLGRPVLVEDTGLAIHAWNGLPGALVRWFLKTVGPAGICRMLDSFPTAPPPRRPVWAFLTTIRCAFSPARLPDASPPPRAASTVLVGMPSLSRKGLIAPLLS